MLQYLQADEIGQCRLGSQLFELKAINFSPKGQLGTWIHEELADIGVCEQLFGWKYTFNMPPHVKDIDEFVTPVPVVVALAAEVGLRLVKRRTFSEWQDDYGGPPLSPELRVVSALSSSCEFVKER